MNSSGAASVIGNDLYAAYNSNDKFEQGFCSGFIQAAKYAVADFPNMPAICKSQLAQVPLSQLEDVVQKELSSRPEQRHYSAFSIAFMSLAKGFGYIDSKSSIK
ncbi:MAG: hypothetical protein COC20_03055 [Cellvibrionales bacterium]|nr:MAG: hypothetical protein COC20_03055 [Cellvibrionales bacterium]